MTKATRWWCVSAVVMGMTLLALTGSNRAQDKMPAKHDAKVLNDTLKDVINAGRKIFNEQGDHAGCYRLFQGSLMSVRPFVAPELQKRIDEGMSTAEKLDSYSDRAFELRKVLDEIRASTKTDDKTGERKDDKKEKATEDKKDDGKDQKKDDVKDKKKDDPKDKKDDADGKKEEKKVEPAGKNGQVRGTITSEGKPIAGGYSATFLGKDKKKYLTAIRSE